MDTTHEPVAGDRTGVGVPWWAGGAVGGIVGALGFGLLMQVGAPAFLDTAIPALYGLPPVSLVGWAVHLVHGAVLGVVFAAIVERRIVRDYLTADVETDALERAGIVLRMAGAGLVYGLLIWAILPVLLMPTWLGMLAAEGTTAGIAIESFIGHLLFGLLLGIVYATMVDW